MVIVSSCVFGGSVFATLAVTTGAATTGAIRTLAVGAAAQETTGRRRSHRMPRKRAAPAFASASSRTGGARASKTARVSVLGALVLRHVGIEAERAGPARSMH